MEPSPVSLRPRSRAPVAIAASLAALATAFLLVSPSSSSAGDESKPVSSPRVTTREFGPAHVRKWERVAAGEDERLVSTNAWRRTTAGKTDVGVYIEAYGAVEDANLSMDLATAEDLAEFLAQAPGRAPATLAPLVSEANSLWATGSDSSPFSCRLDLKTGEVEIRGSRGHVTVVSVEVASALQEAIADAVALRKAPAPLPRAAK